MKRLAYAAIVLLTAPNPALSEIVNTTDGRVFDLKSDGTYEEISAPMGEENAVEESYAWLQTATSEYGRESIQFMPRFKNISEKTIVATKFVSVFENSFGDEVFSIKGETDEKVAPGQTSSAMIYYVFENNPFISDEPYDKLLSMVVNKAGTVRTTFTDIAFSDGTVISQN